MTASVVDYYGRKKKGYFALQRAFNPIHVMMDWPDLAGEPAGSTLRRAVYVVNDYTSAYPSLTVAWQVLGAGDAVLAGGTITCAAPANSLQQLAKSPGTSPLPPAATAWYSLSNAMPNPSPATSTPYKSTRARPPEARRGCAAVDRGIGGERAASSKLSCKNAQQRTTRRESCRWRPDRPDWGILIPESDDRRLYPPGSNRHAQNGRTTMTSELKKNLAAYESMKSTLESKERGRIALFSDGKLCDIFNDFGDGYMVGMERFGEGRFSVKRIGEPPVQLGAATLYAEPVQID